MLNTIATETRFTIARLWAAALEEHQKTWRLGDKQYHCDFKGKRIPKAERISEFLKAFEVARTLPNKKVEEFFHEVSTATTHYSNQPTMSCRAGAIVSVIGDGEKWAFMKKSEPDTISKRSRPFSAASKLSWFIDPINWTLFDSYALRALEEKRENENIVRLNFQSFYKRLDELKAADLITAIDCLLKKDEYFSHQELIGSRVLDKMLWIMGSHDYYRIVSGDICVKCLTIGTKIAKEFKYHGLHSHLNKRWGVPKQ